MVERGEKKSQTPVLDQLLSLLNLFLAALVV